MWLVAAPVLVTAMIPVGQVHFGDGVGQGQLQLLEFGDDVVVAEPVIEHLVNAVSDGFGQAGDLAVARMVMPAEEGVDVGKIDLDGGARGTTSPRLVCQSGMMCVHITFSWSVLLWFGVVWCGWVWGKS